MSMSPQDSIIMMDASGCISYWNAAAEAMFGWCADEVLGRDLHSLIVPERFRKDYETGLKLFFQSGKGNAIDKTLELSGCHKDGHEFPIELTLGAVSIRGEWHSIGVVRDVAGKRKLEFQLLHAEKMESVATLAGGIAHDFNNILSSIIGFTELALDDADEGTLLYSNLQEVMVAGNRAKDLVRQIMKFSRQTDSVTEPVQVKSVVEETVKLIRASFPSTIEIVTDLKSRAFVLADPSHIHQIILNLCTNAEHAMEDSKGVLSISLSDVTAEEVREHIRSDVKPGSYIRLKIGDTGKGMTTEILSKAFSPFFTTKKQGEGTGMGLPIVHGIVSSLNGFIHPHSEPGRGSSFDIFLPVMEERIPKPLRTKASSSQGGHLMFVDDEASVVKIGKILLERLGYTVETAGGGCEALELFKASPSKYSLVITDLTMPQMTGIDLAKEMIRVREDIPIILCTGYEKNHSITQATEAGIMAVVSKPILSDEIAETIGRVLNPV